MRVTLAALAIAAPFAAAAQTDIKCAGWEVDRHFILQILEKNAKIVGDTLSEQASDDAREAMIDLNAANQKAMSNFMETKRLFDRMCRD